MDNETAIKVESVSKVFRLPHERNASIKSALINFKGKTTYEEQQALNNVSFEVKKGEFFGIVGRNGSGKSTLLKLLAGIYAPSSGSVQVKGQLTPFIELGVGFNYELTGRENIFLNGALLGFNRKEMQAMYNEIVEFAELEKFMDQKLKNYSSGMQVRLAFSIAIRAKSDILLLDEVLAVGDSAFQQKCFDVFRELKKQKQTMVLVTHDMANVERFCDKVLVLNNGVVLDITSPQKAASTYARLNVEKSPEESSDPKKQKTHWGTGEISVNKVSLSQDGSSGRKVFETGKNLKIEIQLNRAKGHKETPFVCGLAIHNKDGVNLIGPNTTNQKIVSGATKLEFEIKHLPFAAGVYYLTVALYDEEIIGTYDMLDKETKFSVISDHTVHGLFELNDFTWHSTK
jgi:ABC-type polysaccharide/polyol phosphate transport system ATPase subunit